jgi:hypothetical protein
MDAPAPIPEPFRQTAPGRVVIREGGGCLSAFGTPFLAAETSLRAYARAHAKRFRRPQFVGRLSGSSPAGGAPAWMRRLVKSRGIQVKCRQGIVAFGAGLPDDEVRYLHALVESALGEVKR